MKINYIQIFIILLIFLSFSLFNCKKTKISKKNNPKKEPRKIKTSKNTIPIADTIRPSDVSRELFCDVCQAIITEALKNLRYLNKESDITFYLTNGICAQNNFNNYHFSKPEMEIGCEVFIGEYYDELQRLLIERNPKIDKKENLIQDLCFNKIKACNGVDLSKIKPIEYEIVNGELYDIEYVEEKSQVYPHIQEVNFEDEDNLKDNNRSEL